MFKFGLRSCLILTLSWSVCLAQSNKSGDTASQSFAVVELFTSQGCSSCPAADRYLSQLTKRAERNDLPLYTLSFHVDYWDYLGWKDPFASKAFTQRQRNYASHQRSSRVYTPQMMINGQWGFVGSDRSEGDRLLAKALSKKPKESLSIAMSGDWRGSKISVDFSVAGEASGYRMNVALVETNLSRKVLRGENRGRKLDHDHVVRAFTTETLGRSGKGNVSLTVPEGVDRDHVQLIGYVQERGPGEIVAVTMISL